MSEMHGVSCIFLFFSFFFFRDVATVSFSNLNFVDHLEMAYYINLVAVRSLAGLKVMQITFS